MHIQDETVEIIRNFNRFYTVNMGFLNSGYLDTEYSIAETRILFEIKVNGQCSQREIVKTLHIDKSYLSRIIKRFFKAGLIEKRNSEEDKRAVILLLTDKGNEETERLIALTNQQIQTRISSLNVKECRQLRDALNTVISILGREGKADEHYSF